MEMVILEAECYVLLRQALDAPWHPGPEFSLRWTAGYSGLLPGVHAPGAAEGSLEF